MTNEEILDQAGLVPLASGQCEVLLKKYPNDIELWRKFWDYMASQSAQGASFEYVAESCNILEQAWLSKPKVNPQPIRRGLFKRTA